MAMSQAILATELKALALYDAEAAAAAAWAAAYRNFFEGDGSTHGAESNAVYVLSTLMDAAEAAMEAALSGMSDPGAGAAKIVDGITAFWSILSATPASAWATVTIITPPPALATLATTLQTTFDANRDGNLSKDDSMDAIAADIYTGSQGGTATWPGPTPMPIT